MPDGSSSQSRFTVLSGSLAGKELVVEQTVENILIGSDSTCRFHLPTPGVSPIHARLWMDASGVTVYDTNSPRGLFVNDDKVKGQAPLRNGDILWLGTPGDDDVVMIQCRLPTREAVTAPPAVEEQPPTMVLPAAAAPSDAEETMMLGASSKEQPDEPAEVQPEETSIEASEGPPTIASGMSFPGVEPEEEEEPEIEAENFEPLGEEAASAEPEPEEESAATVEPEPLDESAPTDVPAPEATLPLGAERRAPTPTMSLPDDFMIEETQFFGSPPTEAPTVPPPAEEPPPAVEEPPVEEPHPEEPPVEEPPRPVEEPPLPEEEAVKFSLDYEETQKAPYLTPVPPHSFEDETGHSAYDSEAPTMMAEPKAAPPVEAEPPAPELPPTVLAPPPTRYEAPPLVHPPKPAASRPRPTGSTKAVRPPEFATAGGRSEGGSSTGRYVVFGAIGLVLLGAIGFFGVRFLRGRSATTATTTTPPETVTPTTMAALPPPTTAPPRPVVTPTPPVEEAVTIVQPPPPTTPPTTRPAAPSPATVRTMPPAPSPAARATPTPRPATPVTTTPAAPSAEAVRAQQLASLLGQADAAASAHNYDSAAGLYDQALKLDPQNSKASAGKAAALASAGALKKTFVTGRTSVQSGKTVKKTVAGFDSEDVSVGKAPDYSGRIEFEVSPRNVKPGDSYSARVFLSNDGKKAFKISTLNVVTSTNGSESGGQSSPPVKEVQPQQRVALKEVSGVWQEGTSSWNLEVAVVSDRGDVFKNTVTWR